MSAFKQSMRKFGVRAGLLAGTSAAVLAISGIGAGSAMASETCPNNSEIHGRGSSLQKIAQETWTGKYNTACANEPKVTYESTSSGSGLEAFGFKGGVVNHSFQFIGTDDAPNEAQIASAEGAVTNKTKPIIVPVTQTAIAVVIHPPSGCHFASGTGIVYKDLNKIFGGNGITNWNQITNIEGTCNAPITRVVRADGSGTSYQFKNYLSVLETTKSAEGLPCTVEGHTKWAEMREVGAENKPNIVWPECAGSSSIMAVSGGGGVAETVKNEVDAIGYASLPDAKAKGAEVANLQNGVASEVPSYAEPGNSSTSTARCENARYTVPLRARSTSGESEPGIAVDWSAVFGAKPNIGGTEYPLCTLTYDAGWKSYAEAGYTAAIGAAAKGYISKYILGTGQSDLSSAGKWYSTLPVAGGAGSATDVQDAAEFAAKQIG
jgi:ABC-type phosphate transport system substrate-binding protein